MNENSCIFIKISLNFPQESSWQLDQHVVQITAGCRAGAFPLLKPMMNYFTGNIFVTRAWWDERSHLIFFYLHIDTWSTTNTHEYLFFRTNINNGVSTTAIFVQTVPDLKFCLRTVFAHCCWKINTLLFSSSTKVYPWADPRARPDVVIRHVPLFITMTSWWARWRLKPPGSQLFTQQLTYA